MKLWYRVQHFAYLWKGSGRAVALHHAALSLISSIYRRKTFYLTLVRLDPDYATPPEELYDADGTRTAVVENVDELNAFRAEFVPGLSYADAQAFLQASSDRFVALARQPRPGGQDDIVVGYRLCERGRFTFWDGRIDIELGPEYFAVYTKVVAPDYRGQNLSAFMRRGLFDYCRRRGMYIQVGMIGTHNLPSVRSFLKPGLGYTVSIAGVAERTQFFRGLFERHTPEQVIRQDFLNAIDQCGRPSVFETRIRIDLGAIQDAEAAKPASP